jgi:hypothetical protein
MRDGRLSIERFPVKLRHGKTISLPVPGIILEH